MDAGGCPLQRRARKSGGGKNLRLLGHPQYGRERFRAVDRQRPGALPIAARRGADRTRRPRTTLRDLIISGS